ncbi:zinc transporter 4, chloroplastic-like [Zingiber officinale]|uniref:Zinc transporter 4, chloroplastic n=1 Tax=Zingiber officinale TaxID=94328 RepID=A0A8J5HJ41_ZINOF|nr:zinc transporter 4, chloroplastic-like [Zingiber officinale]KAG6518230.1 hypothetical protein ZIOFF_021634 [Zingiber officinale]
MALFEDFDSLLYISRFRDQLTSLSERVSASMASTSCPTVEEVEACRDNEAALWLKLVAIAAILIAGGVGVAIPLVGRKRRLMRTDGGLFVCAKAFAAGVILATGFVHMLHAAESSLSNPCLPESPWRIFPFSGFVAMLAALATLVADFVGTQFYERKHRSETTSGDDHERDIVVVPSPSTEHQPRSAKDAMHIVGMRAHAAAHSHSHKHVKGACDSHGFLPVRSHAHGHEDSEASSSHVRHVVVSQILELGILSHSVIIGLSLGVSQSPCTIKPLVVALSFHQFFEGFALGGCIAQAQFKNAAATMMACFFAITTPAGIGVGATVASWYDGNSPRALVVEGLLDSMSAGILIYMALVDLIAADFLSQTMKCNVRLQVVCYLALFLGAGAMSAVAIWA